MSSEYICVPHGSCACKECADDLRKVESRLSQAEQERAENAMEAERLRDANEALIQSVKDLEARAETLQGELEKARDADPVEKMPTIAIVYWDEQGRRCTSWAKWWSRGPAPERIEKVELIRRVPEDSGESIVGDRKPSKEEIEWAKSVLSLPPKPTMPASGGNQEATPGEEKNLRGGGTVATAPGCKPGTPETPEVRVLPTADLQDRYRRALDKCAALPCQNFVTDDCGQCGTCLARKALTPSQGEDGRCRCPRGPGAVIRVDDMDNPICPDCKKSLKAPSAGNEGA